MKQLQMKIGILVISAVLTACGGGSTSSSGGSFTPSVPNNGNTDVAPSPINQRPNTDLHKKAELDATLDIRKDLSGDGFEARTVALSSQERKQLETTVLPLTPNATDTSSEKWRTVDFVYDPQPDHSQPFNQGISKNPHAADFNKGAGRFAEHDVKGKYPYDLKELKDRALTDYDAEFLTKAEIIFNQLQTQDVHMRGKKVGTIAFVNQTYSSYMGFKAKRFQFTNWRGDRQEGTGHDMMASYVAIPTPSEKLETLKAKGKVTYEGRAIANKDAYGTAFNVAKISLIADLDKMTIKGKVTHRDDMLLFGQEKFFNPNCEGCGQYFTQEKDNITDPMGSAMRKRLSSEDFNARIASHKTKNIILAEAKIQVKDGVLSFHRKGDAIQFEYEDEQGSIVGGASIRTSEYGGVFAGPNGEEVVGHITSGDNYGTRMSFGASKKK